MDYCTSNYKIKRGKLQYSQFVKDFWNLNNLKGNLTVISGLSRRNQIRS